MRYERWQEAWNHLGENVWGQAASRNVRCKFFNHHTVESVNYYFNVQYFSHLHTKYEITVIHFLNGGLPSIYFVLFNSPCTKTLTLLDFLLMWRCLKSPVIHFFTFIVFRASGSPGYAVRSLKPISRLSRLLSKMITQGRFAWIYLLSYHVSNILKGKSCGGPEWTSRIVHDDICGFMIRDVPSGPRHNPALTVNCY